MGVGVSVCAHPSIHTKHTQIAYELIANPLRTLTRAHTHARTHTHTQAENVNEEAFRRDMGVCTAHWVAQPGMHLPRAPDGGVCVCV